MPFTYTYTARSLENPDRVLTFTIIDDYLKVNLTGLFDQVSNLLDEEGQKASIKKFFKTQTSTALFKLVERLSGPVHVNDVSPVFEDDKLKLIFWKRVAGLRLAPLTLVMGSIDNPDAAAQFIETLMDQQEKADEPGFFSGPLDYWATWVGLVVGLIALIRWPRKKKEKKA